MLFQVKTQIGDATHPVWTIPVIANGKVYLRRMQRRI
jgi:hypothetical protein